MDLLKMEFITKNEFIKVVKANIGMRYRIAMQMLSNPNREMVIAGGIIETITEDKEDNYIYIKLKESDNLERFPIERIATYETNEERDKLKVTFKDDSYFRIFLEAV